jgi:hypothetical protein
MWSIVLSAIFKWAVDFILLFYYLMGVKTLPAFTTIER